MQKVLIVDDNENNRMLLRVVLEDYADEHRDQGLIISEAVNGVEAVAMAMEQSYNLILMDIMMPEMDGIEATRQIRAHDSKVMIIAVSAVDDAQRQKEILRCGAEDYISKPINTDIFLARLSNYFDLITARSRAMYHHKAANLFTQEIYCREVAFCIEYESHLAEFWEYYLLDSRMERLRESLSDTIRTLYAIGSIAFKSKLSPCIIMEESTSSLYFTMEGLESLEPKIIRLVLAKNPSVQDYRLGEGKISIRVSLAPEDKSFAGSSLPEPIKSSANESAAGSTESVLIGNESSEIIVYDYMDDEDLAEMKDYISKLDSLLLLVGGGDIHSHEVEEIAQNLERIGRIASLYPESYTIGQALSSLAEKIRTHMDGFLEKSAALGPLCAAFSRDLTGWIQMIFVEGAPSVNYMDDTIASNGQMIGSMLSMDEPSDEAVDLDDIFDF